MNLCKICFHHLDEGCTLKEYFFENDVICGNCRHKFIENNKIYNYKNLRVHAFYIYDDYLENLLFQYKEGRDIALYNIFLWKYKEKLNDIFRQHVCVIMPSHEDKIKQRGFHHIKEMLSITNIKIEDCFTKTKNYKQSLQRSKNRENIHDVVQLKYQPTNNFYFFDDVITTGNTLLTAYEKIGLKDEVIDVYALSVHPHFVELCDKEKL